LQTSGSAISGEAIIKITAPAMSATLNMIPKTPNRIMVYSICET
jgi:hypothetical protein